MMKNILIQKKTLNYPYNMKTKIIKVKTENGEKQYEILIKSMLGWSSALCVDGLRSKPILFESKKKAKEVEKKLQKKNLITYN